MLVVDSPRDMVAARKLIASGSAVDLDRLADAGVRMTDAVKGTPAAVGGPTAVPGIKNRAVGSPPDDTSRGPGPPPARDPPASADRSDIPP
jgi:hypothetical protein